MLAFGTSGKGYNFSSSSVGTAGGVGSVSVSYLFGPTGAAG